MLSPPAKKQEREMSKVGTFSLGSVGLHVLPQAKYKVCYKVIVIFVAFFILAGDLDIPADFSKIGDTLMVSLTKMQCCHQQFFLDL